MYPITIIQQHYLTLHAKLFMSNLQPKLLDEKQTTIYKRAVDKNYHLKMKASRFIFSEINQKFPILPFTARSDMLYLSFHYQSYFILFCLL